MISPHGRDARSRSTPMSSTAPIAARDRTQSTSPVRISYNSTMAVSAS